MLEYWFEISMIAVSVFFVGLMTGFLDGFKRAAKLCDKYHGVSKHGR